MEVIEELFEFYPFPIQPILLYDYAIYKFRFHEAAFTGTILSFDVEKFGVIRKVNPNLPQYSLQDCVGRRFYAVSHLAEHLVGWTRVYLIRVFYERSSSAFEDILKVFKYTLGDSLFGLIECNYSDSWHIVVLFVGRQYHEFIARYPLLCNLCSMIDPLIFVAKFGWIKAL